MLVAVFAGLAGTGCYRASSVQRDPMVAEVLPETGGDRVKGLKSKSGSGDYYLGNDFIQVAIDSTVYGDGVRIPLAGAASGGSIVDAGYIALDNSYNRVSAPGNALNRITPVVNQDPTLQMVFSTYSLSGGDKAAITMTGSILDPENRLHTGSSPAAGISVVHSLSLAQLDRFITLTTTVTNGGSSAVPIYSIGDFLTQQGGGYHVIAPANFSYQGVDLTQLAVPSTPWGSKIPAYCDFSAPAATPTGATSVPSIAKSVQAPMVGLINGEPGADTLDSHASLGFLPVDAEQLLVASDPQDLLTVSSASASLRPAFPPRVVVGSLPATGNLAAGASLTFTRRLYILGGTSVATDIVGGLRLSANYANQGTGLFNLMDVARYTDTALRSARDVGTLTFSLSGASQRQGPLPTEVRIDRNVTPQLGTATWQTQRVEMFEPNENAVSSTGLAPSTLQVLLPVGIYRMVLTNQNTTHQQVRTVFEDTNDSDRVNMSGPIWIRKDKDYIVSTQDILDPEASFLAGNPNLETASATSAPYSTHYFVTREADGPTGSLQPLRITLVGNGSPDPVMRRQRTLASNFSASSNAPAIAAPGIAGQFQFKAGNELFGTGFTRYVSSEFAWLLDGNYLAYGSRGPLSDLTSLAVSAFQGQTDTTHTFTVFPQGMPSGWTSFDMPGPSQATTGFYLPGEKLASAMANGIQVVGHTEQDRLVDAPTLYTDFTNEFYTQSTYQRPYSLSDITRSNPSFSSEPFVVGARTSDLAGYGTVSALFTPVATSTRLGGAQDSSGWILADFLAQAQGSFNVVHRPRATVANSGTDGLFTRNAPLPTAAWWTQTGLVSMGLANGNFDALELLRGESFSASNPGAWFDEFKQVRADWFGLLNYQSPTFFTKALGLSSARYSLDTPVGLARTYLKASPLKETDLSGVLSALQSGAAVASTGPLLDVSIGTAGPGGLVSGPLDSATLVVNLWKSDWMPVDELRVFVNGNPVTVISHPITAASPVLTQSGTDPRLYSGTITLTHAELRPTAGKDVWVVVQAGVADGQTGAYQLGTPWHDIMRGIYPIAVTNPIFLNVTGGAYKPPSL